MGGHGADANLSAFFLNIREIADAAEINEHLGLHQAKLHGRKQAVAAGQNFGIIFMAGLKRESFVEGFGGDVIKACWDHDCLLRLRGAC